MFIYHSSRTEVHSTKLVVGLDCLAPTLALYEYLPLGVPKLRVRHTVVVAWAGHETFCNGYTSGDSLPKPRTYALIKHLGMQFNVWIQRDYGVRRSNTND